MQAQSCLLFYFIFLVTITVQADETEDYADDIDDYLNEDENGVSVEEQAKSSGEYRRELEKKILNIGATIPTKNEKVSLNYVLAHMPYFSIDEKKQMFFASFTICLTWVDERMKWTPSDYNDISYLSVGPRDIWSPKLIVLGSGSGAHEFADSRPDRIKIRDFGFPLLVTCPTFFIKVGCPLDLTNFPNDQHNCSFVLRPTDNKVFFGEPLPIEGNTELFGNFLNYKKQQKIFIFAITITEDGVQNRTISGSFEIIDVNDTTLTSDQGNYALVISVNFRRNTPYYFATVTLPSIIFAVFNICGSLIIEKSYAASLFLINILFIGIFLQDMIEFLPLHFDAFPDQVIFWAVHLLLAICGVLYHLIQELRRRHSSSQLIVYKIPANFDDWTTSYLLRQFFSFPSLYIMITTFTSILYFF